MNTLTKTPVTVVAAFALFAAFSAGVHAADVPQVKVNYADLNVSTQAGATVLYQRIRGAAKEVCVDNGTRDIQKLGREKACFDHAVAQAVALVNAPALTGVYEVKMGKAPVTQFAAN